MSQADVLLLVCEDILTAAFVVIYTHYDVSKDTEGWWVVAPVQNNDVALRVPAAHTAGHETDEREGLHQCEDKYDGYSRQVKPCERLNPCDASRVICCRGDGYGVMFDVVLHQVHLFVQCGRMFGGEVEQRQDERHDHNAHQHAAVEPMKSLLTQEEEETTIKECQRDGCLEDV